MNNKWKLSALSSAILLAACGGGGGGAGGSVVSGGIGGTGSGTVTGFGSIIINDIRRFDFSAGTTIRIGDDNASESDLAEGMVVEIEVEDDVNDDFTAGTLLSVTANSLVEGPVSQIAPLQVLGQSVLVTADTVLANIPGNDVAGLQPGDEVEIYGHLDSSGVIRATRIESKTVSLPEWEVTGYLQSVNGISSFTIGTQVFALNGVTPQDCGNGFSSGALVEAKAIPMMAYSGGVTINTLLSVECKAQGLAAGSSGTGTLRASFEGFVDAPLTSVSDFTVNGQRITTSVATTYEGGTSADLAAGVRIEAEGVLDRASGTLSASKIKFRETRFRAEGPSFAADVIAGTSLQVFGITVLNTAQTEDDDNLFNALADRQIEVRGFVDSNDVVYAEEVRDRGNIDPTDTRLRGPVSNIGIPTFEIQGVTIDTIGATFRNAAGQVIDQGTFFNSLSPGRAVQVQDATYNGVDTLSGGVIELED